MDVRSEILRVATRLFAAHGFDGTSLQDIAEAVGIRKPSLLYHFASKDELRLAVLAQLLERWNEVLPRLLMAAAGGEHRFSSVIEEMVRFFSEDPDRARLIMREILDRPDDMRARLREHVVPWIAVVADYIRKGRESGEVHAAIDPEAYVVQVINLVVSGVALGGSMAGALLPDGNRAEGERHTNELVRMARASLFRDEDADRPVRRSAPQKKRAQARSQ